MEKQTKPDALDRALTDLYRADVPEGYSAAWRSAVKREERFTVKPTPKRRPFLRVALPLAAALTLVIGALSAGNLIPTTVDHTPIPAPTAAKTYASVAYDNNADSGVSYGATPMLGMSTPESAASGGTARDFAADTSTQNTADSGAHNDATNATTAKIVRTADLTLATADFDTDTQALTDLTQKLGGYVASVSVYGEASERMDRVGYYSLRIPSDQLDTFLTGLGSIGRITSRSETATDQTTQYSDTQMRLTTQQEKMTRLQELLKQATDVSDLLEIESEIANTQYNIDSMETSLRTIDRNVDNSAVSVTLQEQSAGDTAQAAELTLWQRLGSGLRASLEGISRFFQNMLVFLAMALPVLVPLAVIGLVVWLAVRARRKRNAQTPGADAPTPETHGNNDTTDNKKER